MRKHNGIFYEQAKSGDPTVKIQGVENFVENMLAAMQITGNHEHDELLTRCATWSGRACYEYFDNKDVYKALYWCNLVMQRLTFMGYDRTLVTVSAESFRNTEGK